SRTLQNKRKKKVIRAIITGLIFVLVAAILYFLGKYIWLLADDLQQKSIVVQRGSLEKEIKGRAVVLQVESTYYAKSQGYFENAVTELEKVRRGALVGYFVSNNQKTPMYADQPGLFTMQIDGLEKALHQFDFERSADRVFDYKPAPTSNALIESGQGMYKIIDNLSPTRLCIKVKNHNTDFLPQIGQQLYIITRNNQEYTVNVEKIKTESNALYLLVRMEEFYPDLLRERFLDVKLIQRSPEGHIIPEKALVKRGNKRGVYCLKGEKLIFKPVQTLMKKDDQLVVKGLEDNDFVVLSPRK
ncbi:MAG TPA: hypothetical protein GX404_05735, partial [Syntrophomonadaceae bacterium]|nr:hypothetical protein [Syntrophomonadaceae bacterium]